MEINWQTLYYIVATISMAALLFLAVYLFFFLHMLQSKIKEGARNAAMVGTVAKISVLKGLLKLFR
jgi:heme/copper-type cytochrome/quinol oxidase subunit 4